MMGMSSPLTRQPRAKWGAVLRPILRVDLLANAKALDDPIPARTAGPIACRLAVPDDFPHLASLAEAEDRGIPDFPPRVSLVEEFERRHRKGDVCLLAEVDRRIAYFSWMCFDAATLPGYGVVSPLLPGEAYVNMTYTLPAYRGRGVATAAGLERQRWFRDHGIRRAYGWTRAENRPALKVRDRAGWRAGGSPSSTGASAGGTRS